VEEICGAGNAAELEGFKSLHGGIGLILVLRWPLLYTSNIVTAFRPCCIAAQGPCLRVVRLLQHIPHFLHIRVVPDDFELCFNLREFGEVVRRELFAFA
jgi:hypothetical protein